MIDGPWFVTPHAVRRFIERVAPGMTYEEAIATLIRASKEAKLVRTDHHPGVDVYRTPRVSGRGGMRMWVSRRGPGAPQLMTVRLK